MKQMNIWKTRGKKGESRNETRNKEDGLTADRAGGKAAGEGPELSQLLPPPRPSWGKLSLRQGTCLTLGHKVLKEFLGQEPESLELGAFRVQTTPEMYGNLNLERTFTCKIQRGLSFCKGSLPTIISSTSQPSSEVDGGRG